MSEENPGISKYANTNARIVKYEESPMNPEENQKQIQNMRSFYKSDRVLMPMTGDDVEWIKLAIRLREKVAITMTFSKPEIFGEIISFNPITGRITLVIGERASAAIRTFLKRDVKMFMFSKRLYDIWAQEKA